MDQEPPGHAFEADLMRSRRELSAESQQSICHRPRLAVELDRDLAWRVLTWQLEVGLAAREIFAPGHDRQTPHEAHPVAHARLESTKSLWGRWSVGRKHHVTNQPPPTWHDALSV